MNMERIQETIKHGLYMIAELPLGILYFVIAVTGISLSIGLTPLFLLGIPLFVAVMAFASLLARLEYARCGAMLKQQLPPLADNPSVQGGILRQALRALINPQAWKGILLMILKLPLGIVSFTVTVTLIVSSLALLVSPVVRYILLDSIDVDIFENNGLSYFFDIGASEMGIICFLLGLALSYATIRVIPAISKAIMNVTVKILAL